MGDLDLGFVALFLEGFDEVKGIEGVAAFEVGGAFLDFGGGEGVLQQGGDGGDDEPGFGRAGEGHEGLQAVADDVGMGEFALGREAFPGGKI